MNLYDKTQGFFENVCGFFFIKVHWLYAALIAQPRSWACIARVSPAGVSIAR